MADTRRDYAYSEPVWASTRTREHISRVDGSLRLGGGAPAPLCGLDWGNGWHLDQLVTDENLQAGLDRGFVCTKCAEAWKRREG